MVAVIWTIAVISYNKGRGEDLAISLNSGNTIYFHCQNKAFLKDVVMLLVECIKSGSQSYSISFDRCAINKGTAGNISVGV